MFCYKRDNGITHSQNISLTLIQFSHTCCSRERNCENIWNGIPSDRNTFIQILLREEKHYSVPVTCVVVTRCSYIGSFHVLQPSTVLHLRYTRGHYCTPSPSILQCLQLEGQNLERGFVIKFSPSPKLIDQ